jgi:hypothetical protein
MTHVVLQEPDRFGHETSSDQEQKASGNDQEPVECEGGTGSVDKVTDDGPCDESNDGSNGDGSSVNTERNLEIRSVQHPARHDRET